MKCKLYGDLAPVQLGLDVLLPLLGVEQSTEGIPICVTRTGAGHKFSIKSNFCSIEYSNLSGFFRAVSILVYHLKKGTKELCRVEDEVFDTAGVMIDVSRGTVQTVDTLKRFLLCMARMGLNMLMLYTEDVYELEAYPYFGYMRGAYTEGELREVVDFADSLGIELIPCIQTLGHLAKALRWKAHSAIRDTKEVLLIDEEQTYQFIEQMLRSARRVFRSKRIHIGMDEAHDVGLGQYLRKWGYVDRYEILTRHLDRVVALCRSYDFAPMMWSDMFFRLGSTSGDYYDVNALIPPHILKSIPQGLSQVYWDYYHTDESTYAALLAAHQTMGNVVFAGGVWTWTGFSPRYDQTVKSTYPALRMCSRAGIRDVFATIWFSDYSECDLFSTLLGLQIYAEFHAGGDVDEKRVERGFRECLTLDSHAFMALDIDHFDNAPERKSDEPYSFAEVEHGIPVISKQVLYQDILTGLFDKNFSQMDIKAHYENAYSALCRVKKTGEYKYLFTITRVFADVVRRKCDMGIRLKDMYDRGDEAAMAGFLVELHELTVLVDQLHSLYAESFYRQNKPFGFEEMDMRFGGIKARLKRTVKRIEDYLAKRICVIEELEEKRLTFEGRDTPFVHLYYVENMRKA